MSRSGYSDEGNVAMWRGQVASAIRGKRGQQFLRELVAALDAMPEKKLVTEEIVDDSGSVCSLGALGKAKGYDLETLDPYDYDDLGAKFNIAHQLAQEVMYENDERPVHLVDNKYVRETPELRWERMRKWAMSNLTPDDVPAPLGRLLCPKCGVDRAREPCDYTSPLTSGCPMIGKAGVT